MNCVSYTRATCCDPKRQDSPAAIMEQNERIRQFIRKRKWKLTGKYSDRKRDPQVDAAFLDMKEDGVNRKFECVVTDSIWQCGKDVFQAVMLLKRTFYPAGIQFAVVEDDFCSADKESGEVEAYLENAWSKYQGRDTGERLGMFTVLRHLTMYGYVYDQDTNVLSIDEASAAIVRELFERMAVGEKPAAIGKDLTKRGVETPSQYAARLNGEIERKIASAWTAQMIHSLVKNPKYCGRWEREINGKNLADEVGCIVSPELFEAVQMQMTKRCTSSSHGRSGPGPTAGRMWDKESGMILIKYSNIYRNITDIRFRYPKEKDVFYDKVSMDYEEFMERVKEALKNEKQQCLNVCDNLYSDIGKDFIDHKLSDLRVPVPGILEKMAEVEKRKMACYEEYRQGAITEITYKKKKGAYLTQLYRLDEELEEILKKMDDISKMYSDKNPWITRYRHMEDVDELTYRYVARYADKILVYRFETLEIEPYHKEWKEAFPEEWLEGRAYGTEE